MLYGCVIVLESASVMPRACWYGPRCRVGECVSSYKRAYQRRSGMAAFTGFRLLVCHARISCPLRIPGNAVCGGTVVLLQGAA